MALDSRLKITFLRNAASVFHASAGGSSASSPMPLRSAASANERTCTASIRATSTRRMRTRPKPSCSILRKSSTSWISSLSPRTFSCITSVYLASRASPAPIRAMRSFMPLMSVRGVQSSWEMLTKKLSRASWSLARCSSSSRATMRCCCRR